VDIAAANIARLQPALADRPNVRVVCADVCEPGLADRLGRTFDAAYALEVFELLPDPGACLRNLAAALRPGGTLLLQFPNHPPPRSPGMTHFRTRQDLGRLLAEAGFGPWAVYAVTLRRPAAWLYEYLHEKPMRAYRRRRSPGPDRALIYDESWVFQHGRRLEPYKYALHTAWLLLLGAMRLTGPMFGHAPLGEEILNRNLIVLARRPGPAGATEGRP
jgi:SAM-dependent methyltransferase